MMQKRKLGSSDLQVTDLCLGSMTWGTQNTAEEGHDQIDTALDAGINFIDTAEMYPVNPISAETIGRTEQIIGQWFERDSRRDRTWCWPPNIPVPGMEYVRDGCGDFLRALFPKPSRDRCAVSRPTTLTCINFTGPTAAAICSARTGPYDPSGQNRAETIAHMEDALGALQQEVKRGTIRAFGLSNESAWGMTQWAAVADRVGGPRPVARCRTNIR